MSEEKYLESVLEVYTKSSFYEKRKDTYFSDKILRDVFNRKISPCPLSGVKKMSYKEVHRLSTDVMRDLIKGFVDEVKFQDQYFFWNMLYAVYIDPDANGIKELNGVPCTADGLFSIRRIYSRYKMDSKTVDEYETYRRIPIFFFPQEKNGINTTRARAFGDKIDYTII